MAGDLRREGETSSSRATPAPSARPVRRDWGPATPARAPEDGARSAAANQQPPQPWMIIPIGACFAVRHYAVFRFAITKFDLPTPGREPDAEALEERNSLG
ncbi:hypothetical protein CD790_28855 [Streptomyces sp. SAJ15]|nr:hypothetical protein CD790_28855 [Streptomyces sp. SAJ15]